MKVLMITGDKNFKPGYPRFALQAAMVEKLDIVYWGRGALWPVVPDEQYDVVTSQDPFLRGLFAWSVAKSIGARLNVQVHTNLDVPIYHNMGTLWKLWVARLVVSRADSVRVVSEKIKQQVEKFGVHAPIIVLPVFVDIARFKNISPVEHQQKIILWLGRFEPEKDPLYALEIFKKVLAAGIDAKLIMLGKGSLEKTLRESAGSAIVREAAAGIIPPVARCTTPEGITSAAASVSFPGWRDPVEYLAQADVVLCTSLHESWGASIVESLAAGMPVVAPDVGVAREAGAHVAERTKLAEALIEVLRSGERGELKLSLPTEAVWQKRLRESLQPVTVDA